MYTQNKCVKAKKNPQRTQKQRGMYEDLKYTELLEIPSYEMEALNTEYT